MKRFYNLDGLRGIFSLMLVLYHYSLETGFIYSNFIIKSSDLFVDFFFVLSGFVIYYNYQNFYSFNKLRRFIFKRFLRLYPLLFYTVVVFFLFYVIGYNYAPEYYNNPVSITHLVLITFDSLLFMNSTPILGSYQGMNYPSWSISSEMISYLLFGITVFFLSARKRIFVKVIIIIISILILFILGGAIDSFHGNYGFVRGFIGFFSGTLVFEIYKRTNVNFPNSLELVSVLIIMACFYFIQNELILSQISVFLVPLVFSFCILIFTKTNGVFTKMLNSVVMQFFGKISYSVYLNHALVLVVINKLAINFLKINNDLLILFLTMCFLITYSFFTYTLVELKFGKYLQNKISKRILK